MVQSLFIQPEQYTEKVAVEMRLPEDPNRWPQEVLQELYKQVPYVADFEPHVEMDRADGEKGYGFGHIEISNQTEAPTGSTPDQLQAAGIRRVRIPIVIKENMLQPLDLLVTEDSKILPLTEARLRQAIFRPQAFDVTGRTPGDQSMIGQLYPPYRQNYGMGGGGVAMSTGIGKQSSDKNTSIMAYHDGSFVMHHNGKIHKIPREDFLKHFPEMHGVHDEAFGKGGWGPHKADGKELIGASPDGSFTMTARSENPSKGATKKTAGAIEDYFLGEGIRHGRMGKKAMVMDLNDRATAASALHFMKTASARTKTASLLESILPTINVSDYAVFLDSVSSPSMQAAFMKNAAAATPALKMLLEHDPREQPTNKVASLMESLIAPSVVQLRPDPAGGYFVKAASHAYWEPVEQKISHAEAVRRFGEKVVLAADVSGSVTMGEGADAVTPATGPKPGPVTTSGMYKVYDTQGGEHIGVVITNLIDIDDTNLPISLFTNGSVSAVQSDIVGCPAGEITDLPTGPVQGHGFFFKTIDGKVCATVPLTCQSSSAMPGQPTDVQCETFDGRPVTISVQPNIQVLMPMPEEGKLLVPADWQWSPLDKAQAIDLAGGEDDAQKEAEVRDYLNSVVLRSGGRSFDIDGLAIQKVASQGMRGLDVGDVLFTLVGLGVDPDHAIAKMSEALTGRQPVQVKVARVLVPASEQRAEALEKAASRMLPNLRQNLFKEAAFLPDPTAVDTVLSLGFVNPENLATFVSYMPEIDEAQQHMCEILLSARLGMSEVPVGSLEKAVKATESVLDGLRILAFAS